MLANAVAAFWPLFTSLPDDASTYHVWDAVAVIETALNIAAAKVAGIRFVRVLFFSFIFVPRSVVLPLAIETKRKSSLRISTEAVRNALTEIQREETHMRSSAKYRHL